MFEQSLRKWGWAKKVVGEHPERWGNKVHGSEVGLARRVWGATRKPMWLEPSGSRFGCWIGEAESLGPVSPVKSMPCTWNEMENTHLRILSTRVIYLPLTQYHIAYLVKIDCRAKGASWRLLQESRRAITAWSWCWPAFVQDNDKLIGGAVGGSKLHGQYVVVHHDYMSP